ncbi:MAG: peptidylprolyl isomerase, partial [Desulfobacterales bacterium]|nr:peptidylprolyl isomerase [Desulfobacterales bacterium]
MSPSKSRRRITHKKKSNNNKIIMIVALFAVVAVAIVGYIMLGNSSSGDNLPSTNKVMLETSMGNIVIELRDDMPITTTNFKKLVQQGVYDGTIFHRVVNLPQNLVMIQGGDPTTGTWSGGS